MKPCSSSQRQEVLRPTQLPVQCVHCDLSQDVKRSEREADCLSLSSAAFKKLGVLYLKPRMSSWSAQGQTCIYFITTSYFRLYSWKHVEYYTVPYQVGGTR